MTICLIALMILAQPALQDIGVELTHAERTYDAGAAEAVLARLDAADSSAQGSAWREARARALLLAAELGRIDFERLPESAVKERRELGKAIDEKAEAGLAAVELLPDSSEKFRIKADLIGAMIRSNYRAGKLKGGMKAAIDHALRLDPANAKARVSKAKMLVFNPAVSRGDLERGIELLVEARRIDNELEQAMLLQAYAWERLGDRGKAVEIWEQCLEENPGCSPARRALASGEEASGPPTLDTPK